MRWPSPSAMPTRGGAGTRRGRRGGDSVVVRSVGRGGGCRGAGGGRGRGGVPGLLPRQRPSPAAPNGRAGGVQHLHPCPGGHPPALRVLGRAGPAPLCAAAAGDGDRAQGGPPDRLGPAGGPACGGGPFRRDEPLHPHSRGGEEDGAAAPPGAGRGLQRRATREGPRAGGGPGCGPGLDELGLYRGGGLQRGGAGPGPLAGRDQGGARRGAGTGRASPTGPQGDGERAPWPVTATGPGTVGSWSPRRPLGRWSWTTSSVPARSEERRVGKGGRRWRLPKEQELIA